ncbi:hypothetical protein QBC40DRAFT_330455 [Triangularia verruculosa]|uniref:Uncharacterized protein n=1 Tax=Triangularia verruculosa TaxID=2587418 RepID=A0AAN7ARS8_9PEZI|nr:hypothetical protein QBC40DRAFT_330455 [Triangularia verruculosa]
MCKGTISDFWCPCVFHQPSHSHYLPFGIHPPDFSFTLIHRPIADPLKTTATKTSHSIHYSRLSPAYAYCHEYIHSSSFNPRDQLDMGGLCPAGDTITYHRQAFISSRLCDSCLLGGCEQKMEDVGVKTVRRSQYGWRSKEEERERRARRRDRSVSPAGSNGGIGTLGRSKSRSVASDRTAKEGDYERLKKGVESVQASGKMSGEVRFEDLMQSMVGALESAGISTRGAGAFAKQNDENGGESSRGASNSSVPRWMSLPNATSPEQWLSRLLKDDINSIPDSNMSRPSSPVDRNDGGLHDSPSGRFILNEWNSGRVERQYESNQESVVPKSESVERLETGKMRRMTMNDASEKGEITKQDRSQSRTHKASTTAEDHPKPARKLRTRENVDVEREGGVRYETHKSVHN